MPLPIEVPGSPGGSGIDTPRRLDLPWYLLYSNGVQSTPPQFVNVGGGLTTDFNLPGIWAMGTFGVPGPNKAASFGNGIVNALFNEDFAAGGTLEDTDPDPDFSSIGMWGRTQLLDGYVVVDVANGPSPGMKTGIGLGWITSAAIPASPPRPAALLYARMDVPQWELAICRGDATPMAISVGTGVPPPDLQHGFHLRIAFDPGQSIRGYVNGVACAEIVDRRRFPPQGRITGLPDVGMQFFCYTGTDAAADISTACWWPRQTLFLR